MRTPRLLGAALATALAAAAPAAAQQLPAAPQPAAHAVHIAGHSAAAPPLAPPPVAEIVAAANRLRRKPYIWGGGHGRWQDRGYDCSGSVSYVLHAAGLLRRPTVAGRFMSFGRPGRGRWVTIYASPDHVWMTVGGLRFDTARYDTGPNAGQSGPRWRLGPRPRAGFVVRHPAGL